jgi:hypothetical protein
MSQNHAGRSGWKAGVSFAAIGLIAGILVGARPQDPSFTRFQNRWKPTEYLHVERGPLEGGTIDAGWWSADWIMEPADAGFVRIRNRYRNNFYIHNERGNAEAGPIDMGWWSAQWAIVATGDGFVRIQNRWKPTEYLHNERGPVACGPIDMGWWSAQWRIVGKGAPSVAQAPPAYEPPPVNRPQPQPPPVTVGQPADVDDLDRFLAPGIDPVSNENLVNWVIAEMGRQEQPVCWKDSYGNTAGQPLNSCPAGKVKEAALCYTPCQPGYRSDGALRCYLNCPAGTSYSPGFCHYPFGSIGGCPGKLSGLKPACINDNAYNRGVGTPMTCAPGQVQQGGLCYPQCNAGYDHGGPVCWKQCGGAHPVNCGAACGHSTAQCVSEISNMVLSVAELTATIAGTALTGGTATAGISAARTAARTGQKVAAKVAVRTALASARSQIRERLQRRIGAEVMSYAARRSGQSGREVLEHYSKSVLEQAAQKIAMAKLANDAPDLREILEMVDPVGVVAVVNAFDKPLCVPKPMPR